MQERSWPKTQRQKMNVHNDLHVCTTDEVEPLLMATLWSNLISLLTVQSAALEWWIQVRTSHCSLPTGLDVGGEMPRNYHIWGYDV